MKDVRMVLPNLASDTAGASSALFEAGGLTVIHDAAGSMESFVTFDEHRALEGRRTVASRLSRLEAITGDDGILLGKLEEEMNRAPAPFIAIIGSPVPFTIGTDLDGIAMEAEAITGIPAFAVNSSAFEPYDKGAGAAIEKLIDRIAREPRGHEGRRVNLLGATPLDYSSAEIGGMVSLLKAQGADTVNVVAMDGGLEQFTEAAEADANLVISVAGLPAARTMQARWGIPYVIGVPVDGESARRLAAALGGAPHTVTPPETRSDRELLVIGEAVLAKTLALRYMEVTGRPAVAGIVGSDDPEILPDVPRLQLDTEAGIEAALAKDRLAVAGDPLYRLLLPPNSTAAFIERPHRALSSRLYPPADTPLDELTAALTRL